MLTVSLRAQVFHLRLLGHKLSCGQKLRGVLCIAFGLANSRNPSNFDGIEGGRNNMSDTE